jgi:hypothetical protein
MPSSRTILLVTTTAVVVIYLVLCLKFYYNSNRSRENHIIQVGGTEFMSRRSVLREGSVVICDSVGELMGKDYSELYDYLGDGDLTFVATSMDSTGTGELAEYFRQKKDLTLPEENYWIFESDSPEVGELSRRYFANALMTCARPLVMFTTQGAATPVWQSLYDTYCIVCMEGLVELDVFNRSHLHRK